MPISSAVSRVAIKANTGALTFEWPVVRLKGVDLADELFQGRVGGTYRQATPGRGL